MKDIIEEMRDCAKCLRDTPAFSDIPDHVAKAMDRWASRLESMQPAAGPWPEDDHDYDAEERLSVLTDTFYTAYQDYDGDHVRLAPMRDDTQSAIEAAIEAVCAVLGRTTRSVGFCAAGPWRTDVENAPKDGSQVMVAWRNHRGKIFQETQYWSEDDGCWVNTLKQDERDGYYLRDSMVIAFAELNPYQPEDAANE